MHRLILNLFLVLLSVISLRQSFAQDTLTLDEVEVYGKKAGFKKVKLYDGAFEEDENIRGYTQLDIFNGSLTDFWTSEGKECINGTLATDDGPYLNLKWNKDQNGCDWVGMGFGWDNWAGKDISYVIDTLSIEMLVKCKEGAVKNLPWALCLEDYSGGQAWIGFMNSFIQAEAISDKWTKVKIPLSLFPFRDYDVNTTSIKQFMIQVFASGTLQIKYIKLVPFSGRLKEKTTAQHANIQVDGDLGDWKEPFTPFGTNNAFSVAYSDSLLYFAVKVQDDTPRQNGQTEGNLWNGDALEIAFSTNSSADPKRKFLLLSDQHIGINCGPNPYLWNWKLNQVIPEGKVAFQSTPEGYQLECQIPIRLFRNFTPAKGMNTGLEVVVDKGNKSGRQVQEKWNSKSQEGFNSNPSLWGVLEYH